MSSNRQKGNHLAKLIKKFGGWVEDVDIIRFPSVYQKEQFEKAVAKELEKNKGW